MKIYMDNCCLNRPFDDPSNYRNHMESEAVKTILLLCEKQSWQMIGSEVIDFEIASTPDDNRRKQLELIAALSDFKITVDESIIVRAKEFASLGLKAFDAMHLACAEAQAEIFLTVDDRFLNRAQAIETLKIKVYNPLKWVEEVLK